MATTRSFGNMLNEKSVSKTVMSEDDMPFKSDAQRAFMYSKHPEIAKRWRKESGPQKNLPKKVSTYAGMAKEKK